MADQERVEAARPEDVDDAALLEAARGVIRQDADPRLDAHLARMLSDVDAVPARRGARDDAAEAAEADLVALRTELGTARSEAETARSEAAAARARVRILTVLLAAAILAIVLLVALLVLR